MNKRMFIKSAGAVTILSAFGLSLDSCSSEIEPSPSGSDDFQIDLNQSPYNTLQTEGNWLLVKSETLLLVNVAGSISAFSSACTHQQCSTAWSFGANATCGCHGSVFNTDGEPVSGPASSPLRRIAVSREEDILTIG